MSGKKKQWITVLVLVGCLLLLGGVYALLPDTSSEEQEEAEEESLYSIEEREITGLHYSNKYADVSLVKKEDSWILSGDEDFPVAQEKVELMVTDVASMSFSRTVTEECEDLSEYQLDEPTLQIEITTEEGEVKNIIYGMKSDVAGGYYVSVDDRKKVYIVTNDTTIDFEYSVNQLMEVPALPEIETDYVTSYRVDKRKGADFAAVYAGEKAVSKESPWNIEKTYGKTVAGDADGLQNLFDNAYLLELTEGVCYNATEKELKQYGFKKPFAELEIQYFTVKEGSSEENADSGAGDIDSNEDENSDIEDSDSSGEDDGSSIKDSNSSGGDSDSSMEDIPEESREYHNLILYVGELNDTEESYYVRVKGEKGIYLMPVETVDSLVNFDISDCVYNTPHST